MTRGLPATTPRESWPVVVTAIAAAACLMTLASGYSFLAGNHEVYLLDPLRRAGLASVAGDPFVHGTLQYHGIFAVVASGMFLTPRPDVAFVVAFVGLALGLAWGWYGVVRGLGGGVVAFLASVFLYHLLAGDRVLGFYSLLQDGQFNAGNVAAVALVGGLAAMLRGRPGVAGALFGLAGGFHLNYAVVCLPLWVVTWIGPALRARRRVPPWPLVVGTLLAVLPAAANVVLALPAKLSTPAGGTPMEFARFLDLYVRLRHPHHYDASVWPWWLWAAFILVLPMGAFAWRLRGRGDLNWTRWAWALGFLFALQIIALATAGVAYANETFVQLSLWRFGCHAKLLAAAALCAGLLPHARMPSWATAAAGSAVAATLTWAAAGFHAPPGQPAPDPRVLEAAAWARDATNSDALFVVPPGVGSAFPVNARRGHVVSFKLVPQLSSELGGWAHRLADVSGVEDVARLAGGLRGYVVAQQRLDDAYTARPLDDVFKVARRHGATHVLRLDGDDSETPAWRGSTGASIYVVPERRQAAGTSDGEQSRPARWRDDARVPNGSLPHRAKRGTPHAVQISMASTPREASAERATPSPTSRPATTSASSASAAAAASRNGSSTNASSGCMVRGRLPRASAASRVVARCQPVIAPARRRAASRTAALSNATADSRHSARAAAPDG